MIGKETPCLANELLTRIASSEEQTFNSLFAIRYSPILVRLAQLLDELAGLGRQLVDDANADREVAHRPRVGEIDRLDRHGLRRPAHRGLGHDADADVALDQPAHRIEAAQLDAQPQRAAGARRLVREEALQRAGAVEPDEVVIEHFRKVDLRAPRELVVLGYDQHEA